MAGGRARISQASRQGDRKPPAGMAPEVLSGSGLPRRIERLRRRSDFLRVAAEGRKAARPGLVLQAASRAANAHSIGVGFTVSRKVGKAVERNRAKRRLREAARVVIPTHGTAGTDYVIIGRKMTLTRPFLTLVGDLEGALKQVHQRSRRR